MLLIAEFNSILMNLLVSVIVKSSFFLNNYYVKVTSFPKHLLWNNNTQLLMMLFCNRVFSQNHFIVIIFCIQAGSQYIYIYI